jgi:hypothetical protein
MMTRRRGADATGAIAEATRAGDSSADGPRYHDAFASRYMEWLRQMERIEATSLAGLGTLLQTVATRAASARIWADWMALAGAGLQEAFDDAARTQGEWLSALTQCQMEAVKMLLDLGQPAASPHLPGGEADVAAGWLSPWMVGACMRPVQIA